MDGKSTVTALLIDHGLSVRGSVAVVYLHIFADGCGIRLKGTEPFSSCPPSAPECWNRRPVQAHLVLDKTRPSRDRRTWYSQRQMAEAYSLEDVKATIDKLSSGDRSALFDSMVQADREAWDVQIERDFSLGGPAEKWLLDVNGAIDQGGLSAV